MSEFSGQNKELEVLRSKVADVLGVADPKLRKIIIKELFTEEFKDTLPPEFQQAVEGLPVLDNITSTVASEKETPEQKAERLLTHVTRAEFDAFQEYSFVALRSGKGFVSTPKNNGYDSCVLASVNGVLRKNDREDDIVPYPQDFLDRKITSRAAIIPLAVAHIIDPNLILMTSRWSQPTMKWGELFCVVGRKGGRVIIQGGGELHNDTVSRQNSSSFKLVFDSEAPANEYVNWLLTDPKDAYGPVLRRATGSYDEQGNFRQALIPPKEFHDPFSVTPARVVIKDFRHTEPLVFKSK